MSMALSHQVDDLIPSFDLTSSCRRPHLILFVVSVVRDEILATDTPALLRARQGAPGDLPGSILRHVPR